MGYCTTEFKGNALDPRKLTCFHSERLSLDSTFSHIFGATMLLRLLPLHIAALVLLSPAAAWAQWFGPKNLEECVLEKMKGQPPNMVGIARAACLKQFPEEVLLADEVVKSTWCETNTDSIEACVTLKSGYKITKAVAVFSQSNCDSPDVNSTLTDSTVEAKLPLYGSTYKFPLASANLYKCGRFMFYGHKKP